MRSWCRAPRCTRVGASLCARRWVAGVAHSWFTRVRKLLVRYEKTDRPYRALSMLAAAIIAFRKVPARVNVIYG